MRNALQRLAWTTACVTLNLGLSASSFAASDTPPAALITGLKNPESVAIGPDGRAYVSVIGDFDKDSDGSIVVLDGAKAVPFTEKLNDPKGIATFKDWLFVTDKNRILKIDRAGKMTVLAATEAFPKAPQFLNDICVDEKGTLYATDSGDRKTGGGAIFAIGQDGKVKLVADASTTPTVKLPNGVLNDGISNIIYLDMADGGLYSIKLKDASATKIAEGFGRGDGIVRDDFGRLILSDVGSGKIYVMARADAKPVLVQSGFKTANDIGLAPSRKEIMVPDLKAGTVTVLPITTPGYEVDTTPLPLVGAVAFPNLKWTGWSAENEAGEIAPLRPIVLTHANDGSNRIFVATQHGVIHAFPNDQAATKTDVFMDIRDRVVYNDKQNEEGFLGFAFHPKYKQTGEFFVYYTPKTGPKRSVISRFRVTSDDPNKADPKTEEVLLEIPQPFWNHNGGTICFGPDGYLYIGLGDGGAANDPHENGQNLSTLLGSILRIDIDKKDAGKNYAVPKDNPFVGKAGAQPEIYAYGFRNIWRMAFDMKTKDFWVADVGQNLWEEINLVTVGGNYGWNLRESLHPFGDKGVQVRSDLIDPIWEYHHDIGKSITGGEVYRGKRLPELVGAYLYADYVSGRIWALRYDAEKKRVVANQPIADQALPILSFGADEEGDVYYMTYSVTGQGIYRFVKK